MTIRPLRWALAGGLFGLVLGGFVAVGAYLNGLRAGDAGAPRPEPATLPVWGLARGGTGPEGPSAASPDDVVITVRMMLAPFIEKGEIDKALRMIEAVGDAGTGRREVRDQNLANLVEAFVQPNDVTEEEPEAGPSDDELRAAAERAIKEADADGDGTVSRAEFDARSKGEGVAFDDLDADGDGALAAAEIAAYLKERRGPAAKAEAEAPPPAKPVDFARALEVARTIQTPLIRAEALSAIAGAQLGQEDPGVREQAGATLDLALAAAEQSRSRAEGPEARRPDRADLLRGAFWVVGLGLIMTLAFGLAARLLAAFGDSVAARLGEELDREAGARGAGRSPA